MLEISNRATPASGLNQAVEFLPKPAVAFHNPSEVLKDPLLDTAEKRAILASWASDASAVEDKPHLRWLFGTDEPVPVDDVLESLAQLDGLERETPTRSPSEAAKIVSSNSGPTRRIDHF